jgi:hypothetical protein
MNGKSIRMICDRCVYISSLKRFVVENGRYNTCHYCSSKGSAVEEDKVALYIKERFMESYSPVETLSPHDYYMSMESGADEPRAVEYWEPLTDEFDLADKDFMDSLVSTFENEFKDDKFYLDDGSLQNNSYEKEWIDFELDIHHARRFFNEKARMFLDSLFDFSCAEGILNSNVMTKIKGGDNLYRARKADSFDKLERMRDEPIKELGPTPMLFASNQRMTPRGISAMYCALDRKTCISELRPLAGDIIVSGAFSPTTGMIFLDLSKLELISKPELHPFDPGYKKANNAHFFLKKLVTKMSKPNTKKDELAYLSTQVVFEYLRGRFSNQVSGILFPSVQTGLTGKNLVIFPEHCVLYKGPERVNNIIPILSFVESSIMVHRVKAVTTDTEDMKSIYDSGVDFNL